MSEIGLGILLGVAGVAVLFFLVRRAFPGGKDREKPRPTVHASIEKVRSVGELVVFKVITKEIVTAAEHWLGEMGKRYFQWFISTKKMALIFEFEIDFRFDLRSTEFKIESIGEDQYRFRMPKCTYETHIRDISFYDEQDARVLPWLVPDLVNRAFGVKFDESDKNRLKEEAKQQATQMARDLVHKMRSEVQASARQTLGALAKGFGASDVEIMFTDAEPVQTEVTNEAGGSRIEKAITAK